MIHVQIAATLERGGVSGLRWVLVDAHEPRPNHRAGSPAALDGRGQAPFVVPDSGSPVRRATLGVHVACAAVLLFALTAAWWVGSAMHRKPATGSAATATFPAR
jgi:hypothetical protein